MTETTRKTPLTDARWKEEWAEHERDPRSSPAHGMCDFAETLERANAELAEALGEALDEWEKHGNSYEGVDDKRIAALRKLAKPLSQPSGGEQETKGDVIRATGKEKG